MAIITLPTDFSFTAVPKLLLQRRTTALRSKFTAQGQFLAFPYAVWMLEGNIVEYDGVKAGKIRSFLVQLEGQKNTFRLPVPGFKTSLTGYTADRALNANAAVRASAVTVSGGAALAAYLADGDFITIQDELKMVIGDVNFNGAGVATINFKPSLRVAALTGVFVKCLNPWGMFRAADDDIASISISPPVRQGANNFNVIEAIEI